ncbi:MAG: hypothetical protein EOO06_14130 [Chitinophagaceae bacterium]|nr:MAG: hypothetical protein EOO06_14130 [Chitinophagaceae bacterium]
MKTNLFLLLFVLCSGSASGQRYLKGKIKLLNQPVYLDGLNVKASYNGVDYTETTKSDGNFLLRFPATADVIKELQVLTNDFETVEREEVTNLSTQNEITRNPMVVLVCRKGELRRLSNAYFTALFSKEKAKYESLINGLNKSKEEYKRQRDNLLAELRTKEVVCQEQASFYARFDLTDPLYKEAYAHFLRGEYEECLRYLPTDEQVTVAAFSLQSAKNQIVRTHLLKAVSYEGLHNIEKADAHFSDAIKTDPTSLQAYMPYVSALVRRNFQSPRLIQLINKALIVAEEFNEGKYAEINDLCQLAINKYGTYDENTRDSNFYYCKKGLTAIRALKQAEISLPENLLYHEVDYLHDIANYYDSKEDSVNAVNYYRQALYLRQSIGIKRNRDILSTYYSISSLAYAFPLSQADSTIYYFKIAHDFLFRYRDQLTGDGRNRLYEIMDDLLEELDDLDDPRRLQPFLLEQITIYSKFDTKDYVYANILAELYYYAALSENGFADDKAKAVRYALAAEPLLDIITQPGKLLVIESDASDICDFLVDYYTAAKNYRKADVLKRRSESLK